MYLKVREHEKKIAEVAKAELKQHAQNAEKKGDKSIGGFMEGMKALGSAADLLTADIRAAKDLGYNTQEYLWVKQQILAASTAQMAEQFSNAMAANFDKAYTEAKKAHDEASDEQTKKLYADILAGYDKSKQEMTAKQEADPATVYNRQLLAKYESALNVYAHELSKYEDKPGEVTQAMDEMKKKLGRAAEVTAALFALQLALADRRAVQPLPQVRAPILVQYELTRARDSAREQHPAGHVALPRRPPEGRGRRDRHPRRGHHAPPPLAHASQRLRQGRVQEPDPLVQVARHGRSGDDGEEARRAESRRADRGQRGRGALRVRCARRDCPCSWPCRRTPRSRSSASAAATARRWSSSKA